MKKLLTLTLIFASLYVKSQSNSFIPYFNLGEPWQFQQLDFYGDNYDKIQDSLIELHAVKSKKTFSKNKKGQTILVAKNLYNGKESRLNIYHLDSRKMSYKSYYKINNYRIYEWKNWGRAQKQINEYQTINGKEFLKEASSSKKNKIKGRSQYFWNEQGVLDSMHYFSKRKALPSNTIHYYYKNNKLAETKTYEKGKLTTIRKYDCTPLGEIQKKVKQTKICVNTEFDADGNKITVNEYTDQKGRTRKWKTTYIGKSDVVFRKERFDFKNRKTYLEEITPEKHIRIYYRNRGVRKGKEDYKGIWYYDSKKNVTKRERYNKGKLSTTKVYSYDSNGQLTSQKNLDKKGKEYYNISYEYNSIGLKIKEIRKNKKKIYTSTFKYE
jgi:hypothetical protein